MTSNFPPPPPRPPAGPPSGPPTGGPPSGPPGPPPSGPPEFLESGGGGPAEPRTRGGLKRGLLIGGGVVGLAAVSVGAWAAYGFFTTGPQPAQALPADTLGYASIDLDPSGGQKIEALRILNKFPEFEDKVGVDGDDDLRKTLFDEFQDSADCDGLDYEDDVEPWLGDRAAFAAVDVGGEDPDPVIVVQVKDADAADAGLDTLKGCGESDDLGWAISGDWAVLAESDDIADDVVAATEKGSLADDADFQQWTAEAGGAGVATLYAGPAAGDYLADHADSVFGLGLGGIDACDFGGGLEGLTGGLDGTDDGTDDPFGDLEDGSDDPFGEECGPTGGDSGMPDEMKQKFRDFQGLAVTIRFDDGAIELETAGDASAAGAAGILAAGGTADVVTSLPADTTAVLGLGFADGWFGDLMDQIAPALGAGSADELADDLSDLTGLDLPEDAETLAGDSLAVVLGSGFDPDTFANSEDGSDVPVGLKVKGDPDAIESVLDKLREMAGPGAAVLESDSDGDTIVVGPNPDYRSDLLEDGGLGEADAFKDAVREADKAQTVMFVDVNELERAIEDFAGEDEEFLDNVKPIAAVGASGWIEDDVAHAVIRITTD